MEIPYTLIRASRKTISIRITPAGEVVVRCPRRMAKRDVEAFVQSKADWIRGHLENCRPAKPLTQEELEVLYDLATAELPRRAAHFAGQMGVSYGRVTIRSQRTRWGSCSGAGNLNFNCLLMLCPPQVRDYVVIHELCHRKEMNHSPQFWAQVAAVCPDYAVHRRWLKENGNALIGRLPQK